MFTSFCGACVPLPSWLLFVMFRVALLLLLYVYGQLAHLVGFFMSSFRVVQSRPKLAGVGRNWPESAGVGRSWPELAGIGWSRSHSESSRVHGGRPELVPVGVNWSHPVQYACDHLISFRCLLCLSLCACTSYTGHCLEGRLLPT